MKKVFALVLVLTLLAGGAYAQKKNTKVPPSAATKTTKDLSVQSVKMLDARRLPPPGVGMEASLKEVLNNRKTIRQIRPEEFPPELLSSLLWSAYGFNRPSEQRRVVPSAVNAQEFDIYVFNREGVYLYNALENVLEMVVEGDHRAEISKQPHFIEAPVSLVLVANYDRMKMFKEESVRDFYAAVDCGYISQDIYLFCASAKLATVACGAINNDTIHKILGIKNGRAMQAHPVGFGR